MSKPKRSIVRRRISVGVGAACMLYLSACQDPNTVAMKLGAMPPNVAAVREAETRRLDAPDQVALLSDITQTLQDLGFTIEESASTLGVVTGTKQRDAEEGGQVAGQIALTLAFAMLGAAYSPTWDKHQQINVTTTVAPGSKPHEFAVRVSFDRYLWNNHGLMWKTELILDPVVYHEFFSRLFRGSVVAASAT